MRNNTFIICIISSLLFCACNDWLSVDPKNQIGKDKLYSDETGFQNALNGIYQMCAQPSLYGKNLSWGALSGMSQQYVATSTRDYGIRYFCEFDYYRPIYSLPIAIGIWEGMYTAIANCNLLLNEIVDASPSMFLLDTIARNVIYGEALALRAFLHMDLYRLYTPAPVKNSREVKIPYHKKYPSDFAPTYTAEEGIELAIKDLLIAKDMVSYLDTVYSRGQLSNRLAARIQGQYIAKGGDFYRFRGYRMNYVAIVGLLARAYLYKGDMENAKLYAGEIYSDFHKKKGWYRWHTSNDYTTTFNNKQKKHLDDCLLAFYNNDLLEIIETFYDKSDGVNMQDVDVIFKGDEDDYRRYLINQENGKFTYCIKYRETGNSQRDNVEGNAVPIMRLTEIYHILIECNYDTDPEESLRLLKELRSAMGCKRDISEIPTKEDMYELMLNDARREFMGEGQLFFYYKRLNRPLKAPNIEIEPTEERMTLLVPDSQNI